MIRACFIGRYSPFHNGHYSLFRDVLDSQQPILVLIRDTPYDYYSALERKQMIERSLSEYGEDVVVRIIPDILSVNYGRNVGYDVNEIKLPPFIERISATDIRVFLENGSDEWRGMVPEGSAEVIDRVGLR